MGERGVIAVVGATGIQGGSLVKAILADPNCHFSIRAITRKPQSDKARALAALGIDVVKADLDDRDSMIRAFSGADYAFCMTNYWEHMSPEREYRQAGNMADAAKANGLHHVIWSTLEDTREVVPLKDARMPTLQQRYKVPHFDAKGEANRLFEDRGVPTTFLNTSFYWENLIHFGMAPKSRPDGVHAFTLPLGRSRLPGIAADDIGQCAYGIFRGGSRYIGLTVGVAGEHLTCEEMAEAMSEALGVTVKYEEITPEEYRGFGFPGADDLGNMFQFMRDFTDRVCGIRDTDHSRLLYPGLQSFRDWLNGHGSRIPLE